MRTHARTHAPPPPRPAHSPLAGGPRIAGFAETLGAAAPEDAAYGEARNTEVAVTRGTQREHPRTQTAGLGASSERGADPSGLLVGRCGEWAGAADTGG